MPTSMNRPIHTWLHAIVHRCNVSRTFCLMAWNNCSKMETHPPDIASKLLLVLTEWMKNQAISIYLLFIHLIKDYTSSHVWIILLDGVIWSLICNILTGSTSRTCITDWCWVVGKQVLQFELWAFVQDIWKHRQEVNQSTPLAKYLGMQEESRIFASKESWLLFGASPSVLYILPYAWRAPPCKVRNRHTCLVLIKIRWDRKTFFIFRTDLCSENGLPQSWLGLRRRTDQHTIKWDGVEYSHCTCSY